MAKIFDFKSRKVTDAGSSRGEENPQRSIQSGRNSDVKPKVDKETYLLWMFSRDVDLVISKYVVEHRLPAKEVAAVLAHRLGQLISVTKEKDLLVPFCQKLIARVSGTSPDDPKGDKNSRGAS